MVIKVWSFMLIDTSVFDLLYLNLNLIFATCVNMGWVLSSLANLKPNLRPCLLALEHFQRHFFVERWHFLHKFKQLFGISGHILVSTMIQADEDTRVQWPVYTVCPYNRGSVY